MLSFLIAKEDREAAAVIRIQSDSTFKSQVFAADIHNNLQIYKSLFEEAEEPEIEEYNPKTEDEFNKMIMELKRSGVDLG